MANLISNILGGSLIDVVGGGIVGVITAYLVSMVKKKRLPFFLVFFPILIIPGCGVPIYLSHVINVPYPMLAVSLCIGQIVPALTGAVIVKVLEPVIEKSEWREI
jgi:uncharacterized membrane protein